MISQGADRRAGRGEGVAHKGRIRRAAGVCPCLCAHGMSATGDFRIRGQCMELDTQDKC